MQNTKIGNLEAIALIVIVMVNCVFSNIPQYIISEMTSSSILNATYISIIAIFLAWGIGKILGKFSPFDILDISKWLGGKTLKSIVGILFLAYFIFFTAMFLRNLVSCLRIIYFPFTNEIYIALFFIIASIFISTLKYNAVFRANLFIMPAILISIVLIFFANMRNYIYSSVFPVLGNGAYDTFVKGFTNLFAFQGFALLYFLPSNLKEPSKIKKISIISIIISSLCLILSISSIILLFNAFIDSDELIPLFSSVRYIDFGYFFQRLTSLFVLVLIISFLSYFCIIIKISSNILSKVTEVPNNKLFYYIVICLIFVISLIPKNYITSTLFTSLIYKYAFFILVFGISIFILFAAIIKNRITKKKISG